METSLQVKAGCHGGVSKEPAAGTQSHRNPSISEQREAVGQEMGRQGEK